MVYIAYRLTNSERGTEPSTMDSTGFKTHDGGCEEEKVEKTELEKLPTRRTGGLSGRKNELDKP